MKEPSLKETEERVVTVEVESETETIKLNRVSNLAIVLPVYNEGNTIESTVSELNSEVVNRIPGCTIMIFEDGSKDNTKEVIEEILSKYPSVRASTSDERKGYSKAVRDALTSSELSRYDYVLFADSDGQYYPDDIIKVVETFDRSDTDVVMGRRMNRAESRTRVFLSNTMKRMERMLFPIDCVDVTSALRVMSVETAKKVASKIKYSKYNFWLEFTPRMYEEGIKVKEINVNYRQREGDSNVYSMRKMPKILRNEFSAIMRTWWEYKKKEIIKFMVVGGSGAALILGLTYFFTEYVGFHYVLSAAIAIEISIVWAFTLNDLWTFSKRKSRHKRAFRFIQYNGISLGGMAINTSVLFVLTNYFSVYYLLSEFIGILFAFTFNFLASSKFAWKENKQGD